MGAADLKFKHPFTCIVSGPTGSGKSSFTLRLLEHLDSLCREPNFGGGIIWCYSEKSAVPEQELAALHIEVRFHEGVPQDFGGNVHGKPCLIILYDLLKELYSKDVCDLFTKGSHHRNISVVLITQNLFHQGRFCRDISLNGEYSVALKNVRDEPIPIPSMPSASRKQW
jgi:ABC-type lipoprotein export system ATPase subunit